MSIALTGPRELKRLTRLDRPTRYQHTPRDNGYMLGLANFGALTTEQAARWDGGSLAGTRTRLYHLFNAGFVDRPPQQASLLAVHFHQGATPIVHTLSRKGARHLAALGIDMTGRVDHTFRATTRPALMHRLAVADVMITFHTSVAQRTGLRLVDHHDLRAELPDRTQRLRRPYALAVETTVQGRTIRLTNVPDRVFVLRFDNMQLPLLLELDTGSESIKAKKIAQKASVRRKLLVYFHAHLGNHIREQWGFARSRVLFVCPSEKRIANIIAAQDEIVGRPTGQFLYATPERITRHGILGPAWRSSEADNIRLISGDHP